MESDIKIGFLGDFVLTNSKEISNSYFDAIKKYIDEKDIKVCIDLESPIVSVDMNRIKEKVTLKCTTSDVSVLKSFSPYLINLSNNHINDYGNESVKLTTETLTNVGLKYFGVGYDFEKSNYFFKDDVLKLIYLAYSTRSSDFTGSKLFAQDDFMGVRNVNLQEIRDVKKNNPDYFLVINIHHGIENINFPENEKCKLSRDIVDMGADLVIGHHSHIIQPYEIYKGKYIFYSLGNFYFPEIEFELKGESKILKSLPHQKKGLFPVVTLCNGYIKNVEIIQVQNQDDKQILNLAYKPKKINTTNTYKLFFVIYYFFYINLYNRVKINIALLLRNPHKFFMKVKSKVYG